jgi:LCP family protein required for cell wall assembly
MNAARTKPHLRRVRQQVRYRRYFPCLVLLLGIPFLLCMCSFALAPHTDILVLGVDSRPGEGWMARADSVILVGIDPRRFNLTMMSIPRDLSIDVPGYGLQRINTVNMLGEMEEPGRGPALTAAGIEQSFGVTPDKYVRLDFNGFVRLIDAVGGVTINVPYALSDYAYPTEDGGTIAVEFEAGVQHMDGERALIYARTRHADDDYRRAERQQQVISALLGRLILPFNWPAVLAALAQSVDTNLNVVDMALMAPAAVINSGRAQHLVIDRDYITATANGVAIPDYARIAPWLEAYFE